ncbi:GGDEF domain-containing protein [Selenomonas ruminantium]|uniref:transporter substrate-binding domain-containing diguanylate cyclase n=1 Tax=Selenomonas ruminantium TaxID=971 RepID=UPI0026F2FC6E|nr:GGDEF domain-containing protein [Selenomonas ruminantium]
MKTVMTLLLSLCLLLPVYEPFAEADGQQVKLGFIQPDKSLVNGHILRRYYITYLDELSKQTNWDYQLVNIDAGNAFSQLFAGDIDLLLSVEYPSSLGMNNGIIYSTMDFGYDVEGLYTRESETRFDPQDLNTLNGAVVGVIAHRPINDRFEEFQQNNRLTLTVREFVNQQAMLTALNAGDIDLVVDTATNTTAEEHFLMAYARIPVRVAAIDAQRRRLVEMEQALARLNMENPHFEPLLSQNLAVNLDFQLVHYTPLESQYIQNLPPLRIAIYGGSSPYIEYDEDTHTAKGIYADLIAALAENSGLQFSYVHVSQYQDAIAMLEKGDADIMLDIFTGAEKHLPFYFTNPLLEIPYTFIGNTAQTPSASDPVTLAVPWPEPSLMSYLRQKFPHWNFVETKISYSDALDRVQRKECNLALLRDSTLEIDRPLIPYPNLNIIPDASIKIPTSLVISPTQPRILQSILNKAITQINPEKRLHITQKHIIDSKPEFSLQHIITFYPLQSGLTAGIILFLIAGMFFLSHHQQSMNKAQKLLQEKNLKLLSMIEKLNTAKQKQRHYQELAETDALTGLLNKAAIERAGSEILCTPAAPDRCHALFIIDLDHFKEANDTLGHQRGDDILRRFGVCLSHIVRADDAVGRFGGDEFILILDNIPRHNIERIATRIREAAHNLEPATDEHPRLSASIGIALYPAHGRDYQELLHNADQALYHVKEKGRDGWSLAYYDQKSI